VKDGANRLGSAAETPFWLFLTRVYTILVSNCGKTRLSYSHLEWQWKWLSAVSVSGGAFLMTNNCVGQLCEEWVTRKF